ncbi:hypothetical protein ACVWWP_000756 [Bradyrhizobium sp. LM3.6]
MLTLGELVERDRDGAGRTAGDHDRLVLADEALLRLHRLVRLGRGIGDAELQLFAEHALAGLGRYLLDQIMAAVDVLDRELVTLELVLALHGVGAGARHRDADEGGGTRDPRGVGTDRRLVLGKRRHPGQNRAADETRGGLKQATARDAAADEIVSHDCFLRTFVLVCRREHDLSGAADLAGLLRRARHVRV